MMRRRESRAGRLGRASIALPLLGALLLTLCSTSALAQQDRAAERAARRQQQQMQAAPGGAAGGDALLAAAAAAALEEPVDLSVLVNGGIFERTLEEVLDEGVARLGSSSTWKLWSWGDGEVFIEAEAFRVSVEWPSGCRRRAVCVRQAQTDLLVPPSKRKKAFSALPSCNLVMDIHISLSILLIYSYLGRTKSRRHVS